MSYMIVEIQSGKAVAELFTEPPLAHINTTKYRIEPAKAYLERINREIQQGSTNYNT